MDEPERENKRGRLQEGSKEEEKDQEDMDFDQQVIAKVKAKTSAIDGQVKNEKVRKKKSRYPPELSFEFSVASGHQSKGGFSACMKEDTGNKKRKNKEKEKGKGRNGKHSVKFQYSQVIHSPYFQKEVQQESRYDIYKQPIVGINLCTKSNETDMDVGSGDAVSEEMNKGGGKKKNKRKRKENHSQTTSSSEVISLDYLKHASGEEKNEDVEKLRTQYSLSIETKVKLKIKADGAKWGVSNGARLAEEMNEASGKNKKKNRINDSYSKMTTKMVSEEERSNKDRKMRMEDDSLTETEIINVYPHMKWNKAMGDSLLLDSYQGESKRKRRKKYTNPIMILPCSQTRVKKESIEDEKEMIQVSTSTGGKTGTSVLANNVDGIVRNKFKIDDLFSQFAYKGSTCVKGRRTEEGCENVSKLQACSPYFQKTTNEGKEGNEDKEKNKATEPEFVVEKAIDPLIIGTECCGNGANVAEDDADLLHCNCELKAQTGFENDTGSEKSFHHRKRKSENGPKKAHAEVQFVSPEERSNKDRKMRMEDDSLTETEIINVYPYMKWNKAMGDSLLLDSYQGESKRKRRKKYTNPIMILPCSQTRVKKESIEDEKEMIQVSTSTGGKTGTSVLANNVDGIVRNKFKIDDLFSQFAYKGSTCVKGRRTEEGCENVSKLQACSPYFQKTTNEGKEGNEDKEKNKATEPEFVVEKAIDPLIIGTECCGNGANVAEDDADLLHCNCELKAQTGFENDTGSEKSFHHRKRKSENGPKKAHAEVQFVSPEERSNKDRKMRMEDDSLTETEIINVYPYMKWNKAMGDSLLLDSYQGESKRKRRKKYTNSIMILPCSQTRVKEESIEDEKEMILVSTSAEGKTGTSVLANDVDGIVRNKFKIDELFSQLAYKGSTCVKGRRTEEDCENVSKLQACSPYFQKNTNEGKEGNEDKEKNKATEPEFVVEKAIYPLIIGTECCGNGANVAEDDADLLHCNCELKAETGFENDNGSEKSFHHRKRKSENCPKKAHAEVQFISPYFMKSMGEQVVISEGKHLKMKLPKPCAMKSATTVKVSPYFHNVLREEESTNSDSLRGPTECKVSHRKPKTAAAVNSVFSTVQKQDEAYQRKTADNTWKPPRSPYNLLQEDHFHDPWRVIVICMLLNRTTGLQVRSSLFYCFLHYC
ncbi:unnamed protein product [Ilex paraguariensis]|uniref:Uncharacterized protein n=1 Tax=Ilex paraguariensis TaxID=185542 RepID=A0ABC8URT4_9AQUA